VGCLGCGSSGLLARSFDCESLGLLGPLEGVHDKLVGNLAIQVYHDHPFREPQHNLYISFYIA
jgi:hypothetical protein